MAILLKEVEEIAKLAKLKFNDEEKQKLQKELDSIIIYMDKINELDLENVVRDDIAKAGLTNEEALKNNSDKNDVYFRVPKVKNK